MDSKATIISISQEVLIRENGRYDIASKRKSDLSKLEYCSKVLLASAYVALPIVARPDIHRFEIYAIQTNGKQFFDDEMYHFFSVIIIEEFLWNYVLINL